MLTERAPMSAKPRPEGRIFTHTEPLSGDESIGDNELNAGNGMRADSGYGAFEEAGLTTAILKMEMKNGEQEAEMANIKQEPQ